MVPTLSIEVLNRLRKKDATAIKKWFDTYADTMYTFIYYRIGRDAELAADLVQETFTKALECIEQYDPQKGNMLVWLTYLSRNSIKKALRNKRRYVSFNKNQLNMDNSILQACTQIQNEPLPDEVLEREEVAEWVRSTLANIQTNYKMILQEYYFLRMSVKEIAAHRGTSREAVKVLLYRARKAFKKAFLSLIKSYCVEKKDVIHD